MAGEIRRENFADEASWLEFQHNQLELAKHKRQRELAEQHAKAGRDYDIIKRINRKFKTRERARQWNLNNPDRKKANDRARYFLKNDVLRAYRKAYYRTHRSEALQYSAWWKRLRSQDPIWREQRNKRDALTRRLRYASDPVYRERVLKLAATPKHREQRNTRLRNRYALDAEYRQKVLSRKRERYAQKQKRNQRTA